ncbi:hypothetical protein Angca_009211, partial [Angiostrongylus cantonensis]
LQQQKSVLVNRKGSILLHDNTRPNVVEPALQKLNELGYETLPHSPYSSEISPTEHHFLKHLDNFLPEKCFTKRYDAKDAFNELVAFRTPEFFPTEINKLVSCWQEC